MRMKNGLYEDHSSAANCRTKIPTIFCGVFDIFRGIV